MVPLNYYWALRSHAPSRVLMEFNLPACAPSAISKGPGFTLVLRYEGGSEKEGCASLILQPQEFYVQLSELIAYLCVETKTQTDTISSILQRPDLHEKRLLCNDQLAICSRRAK